MKQTLHRYVVFDLVKKNYVKFKGHGYVHSNIGMASTFHKQTSAATRAYDIHLNYTRYGTHPDIETLENHSNAYSRYDIPYLSEVRVISICENTGNRKFVRFAGFGSSYRGIVKDNTPYTFRNGNPNSDDLLLWIKNKSEKAPQTLADELGASGQRYGFMINQNDWYDNFG